MLHSKNKLINSLCIIFVFISGCMPAQNINPLRATSISQFNDLINRGNKFLNLSDDTDVNNIKKIELLEAALSSFMLARDINNNDPRPEDGISSILIRKGKLGEAEVILNKIINEYPDYSRAYVNLSYLKEKKGRTQEAEILLNKALEINPLEAYAMNNLGGLVFDRGVKNNNQSDINRGKQLITKASLIIDSKNKVIKQNLNAIKAYY